MGYRVTVTSDFHSNIENIWDKIQDIDTLREICKPKASFIACDDSPIQWKEGKTFVFKMYLHGFIIRKTKRFAIPERAVYFLKTKRTAGGTPPPQNIFDRLTPVFIYPKNGVRTLSEPRSFRFVASLPLFRASHYATSSNALYAATLCAFTILPRKARREPTNAFAPEAS